MVECFILTTTDLTTKSQVKKAMSELPEEMGAIELEQEPFIVKIFPIAQHVVEAMEKDSLEGKKGEDTRKQYLNVITPVLRKYVRDIKKVEIEVR
jgi:hypothetical protein